MVQRPNPILSSAGLLALVLGVFLLPGCATLSEEECLTADWRMIGYEDGVKGQSGAHIGEHREACAEHGVTPDMDAYRQGRDEGLRQYCQPENGFRMGARGTSYGGICPGDTADAFRSAYLEGKHLFELSSSVRRTENKIRSKKQELQQVKTALKDNAAAIIRPGTGNDVRARLVIDSHDLVKRQGTLEAELDELEAEVFHKRERLEMARANANYR